MIFYRIFLSLMFILLLRCHFYGQDCKINNYSTENGLPQNNINQLMFDENNKLWIGTQGGLCVFDGYKINQIRHNDLGFRIGFIHKDKKQKIYICDENQNIFQTNPENYKINKLNQGSENNDSWLLDVNTQKTFNDITIKKHSKSFYTNYFGYKFYTEFGKNKSEYCIKLDQITVGLKTFFLLDTALIGLTIDKKWIHLIKDHEMRYITTDIPMDFRIQGFIFNADYDTYWLYDHVIYKLKMTHNQLKAIPVLQNVPLDPIKDKIISGQYNHRTGFFYFGSSIYGLYEVMPLHFKVTKPRVYNLDPLLLSSGHSYYSQSEIDSSSIFVNNYTILRDTDEIVMSNIIEPYIRAVNMVDNKGWLWYNDDQYMIIKKGNKTAKISLAPLPNPISSTAQISPNRYLHLHPHFIIETDTNREIRRFDLGTFKNSDYEYGQYIYYEKNHDVLYLLTNRNVYTVNLNNGQITPDTALSEGDYRIIQPLKDSIFFVGTYGQGYLIKLGNKYVSMPLDKHEFLKFAHAALLDDRGHVWISTNNGLFRTRLQDIIDYTQGKNQDVFYYYYDKTSGFLTNEFNGGCQSPAIRLKNGKFSFSSMDGLVQFDPLQVPALFPEKPIQVLHIWLNRKVQDSLPETLIVSQDIKEIKLEVGAAFYGHPDNLVIEYKIPGHIEEWQEITDKRHIMIQNAKHGRFNIEIRKRRGFGNDDFDYITYPVEVLPYFYQTWWFVSILIILGFLLSYLFSRWYNRYMIQKNKELEALIAEKNAGLIQINKTLTEKIKQNDLFQSILVHDIKSPLRFIVSTTKLILNFWPSVTDEIKKENISHINESASKIGNFVEETLLWIQIRNGEHEPQNSNIRIIDVLLENIELYNEDPKIISGDISVHVECPPSLYVFVDQSLLSTIMRNLLANSIKYSDRGKISLYAFQEKNGSICIGCKDEGRGMTDNVIDAILSDDYKGNSIRKDSFRIGYVIIKEIIRLLDAKLTLTSNKDKGSDICIVLKNTF